VDTDPSAGWNSGAPMTKLMNKIHMFAGLVALLLLGIVPLNGQTEGEVTLTETTITWETVEYTRDDDGAIVAGSLNTNDVIERTFTAYILENEYVQATLIPEYGGRIISLIDKMTGYEHLYQNPLGLPYGIGDGNFYYDWLMVYGGIFPTFPAPEHGKAWFMPWSFDVVEETSDEITVRMAFTDDLTFNAAPGRFDPAATMLEAEFFVSLKAGHRALDTTITLYNPTEDTVRYEYWTCVTLAPGTDADNTAATLATEIIAPVDEIKMPPWWPRTTAQEIATGAADVYTFDALRQFENWADMGIAYAYPTMNGANFWGAINQENQEGLIRIADNTVTPGLKIWTWGAESASLPADIYAFNERRPYVELWAGVTPEFFTPAFLLGGETLTIEELYAITSGLTNVTHASDDVLANMYTSSDEVVLHVIGIQPDRTMQIAISIDGEVVHETTDTLISLPLPDAASSVDFAVTNGEGATLLEGSLSD